MIVVFSTDIGYLFIYLFIQAYLYRVKNIISHWLFCICALFYDMHVHGYITIHKIEGPNF